MFNFEKPTGGGGGEIKKNRETLEKEKRESARLLDMKAAEAFRKADEAEDLDAKIAGIENKLMSENNPNVQEALQTKIDRLKEEKEIMGKKVLEREGKKFRREYRPVRQEELKGDYSRTRLGRKRVA